MGNILTILLYIRHDSLALLLHSKASISTVGKVTIAATFAKKEDLGAFFKTFGNPKALLQTTLSLRCKT